MPFFIRILALVLALAGLAGGFAPGTAIAQMPGVAAAAETGPDTTATAPAALPDPLTPEAVRALVARLSDDQVRALLLARLDAEARTGPEASAEDTALEQIQRLWWALLTPASQAVRALPALIRHEAEGIATFTARHGGAAGVAALLGWIALILALGLAAELAARALMQRWNNLDAQDEEDTLWSAISYLSRRLLREMIGLVVFYLVVRLLARALLGPEQMEFAGPVMFYLVWMPRLAAALARFVLAPERPRRRLVNVDDRWAGFLHRNIVGLVLLGGATIFVVTFNIRMGVPLQETRIGFWFDSAVYVYIALIAWIARDGLSDIMRGTDQDRTRFDEQLARFYPYFAIVAAVATALAVNILSGLGRTAQLLQGAHYVTLFWLLMTPAFDTAIRGLVRHLLPPMQGEGDVAHRAYVATKRSYIRIGRVIVAGVVLIAISNAWDIDLISFSGDLPGIGDNLIRFLMTLVVGYVFFEVFSLWVNRRLAREITSRGQSADAAAGEGGGVGGSRLATVLPLLRVTGQVAIAVVFTLLALGNLGIDITPLLAGAGIMGLAIGFGAQKLVADVVSGVFFLIDDAFRVGEYVEVDGGTTGTVEKISIRSFQLRHHRGPVHTIPYGEIPKLTNYSRDWVIMKLKFTVPFDTDPNKVKKIFKKIGAEMMEDPLHKDGFLEPFKSQGVFDFDDVGMVIRGKFMAKPGQQFTIRKEIYNRVKKEFEAAGIPFARREVRVAIPNLDDDTLSEQEKSAVRTAAAAAAVDQARSGADGAS